MKRLFFASVAVIAAMPLSAGSVAVAQHAALATASPYATQIGLDVMKRGGNAIDAAVAVELALAVAHPQAGNLGGGGFLVYYEAATHSGLRTVILLPLAAESMPNAIAIR